MTRPLQIVRVMPFFHLRRGGSVAQALATCAELAARGHRVRVVTSDLDQPSEIPRDQWLPRDGYEVFHAGVGPLGRVPPYWQSNLARPLQACLPETDVLCLNVGLTWTNAMASRLAARHGVRYAYNAEGALCPTRLQDKALRKKVFLAAYERRTLRNAAAIQALTRTEAGDIIAQGADPSRVHVIPNGVSVPAESIAREAARGRLGWADDDFVILFMGRLTAMKRPDLLLEAAAPLLAEARARLVFAGPDDGVAAALRRQAATAGVSDRVDLPGLVSGEVRSDLWSGADVFALPSRSEGLPLGPLEAAAHGLPLIVTAACNLPEVASSDAGAIVEPSAGALRHALEVLAGNVELRRRQADNARHMIAEHFALARVVDRLEALYRELASR